MFAPGIQFEIIAQQAGVRAVSFDRNPMLGLHPRDPRLVLFNGFGSKGALLIPYYAKCLVDFLRQNLPLPKHADLQRVTWPF